MEPNNGQNAKGELEKGGRREGGREGERKANRPLSKDVSFFEGGVTPAAAAPE